MMVERHYHVGSNMPGYLPNCDEPPAAIEGLGNAVADIVAELERACMCDIGDDACEHDLVSALFASAHADGCLAEELDRHGMIAETVAKDNECHWISVCDKSECE